MQTKILSSLIVLVLSTGISAQQSFLAVTKNNTRLPAKETSFTATVVADRTTTAFGLYVFNPEKKKLQLQISHEIYGQVVDTSFTSEQFNCRYNFEQADDGRYRVMIVWGKEKIIKIVEINTVTRRQIIIE